MKKAAKSGEVCVVLVRTRNPLNIGAAARAMSNFGFTELRVVKPYEEGFREARSAVGASGILASAREFASVQEAVADCQLVVGTTAVGKRDVQQAVRSPEEGGRLIRKRAGRVALLFGSEKTGLSNEDLSHCDWLIRIPTREEHGSMNLGQAVAVCLYELAKGKAGRTATKAERRATSGELERLTEQLLEGLRASGYFKRETSEIEEQKVRKLIRRMTLTPQDAGLWTGMVRQMVWKLKHEDRATAKG